MKKGWGFKELGTVSAINYGYTESASSEPVGPRFLRITDIQDDRVDWDSVPYCRIESADLPKYRLASGDIVFARTGATTGKSFLVDEPPDAVFASYLIRLRLLDKKLLPEFVSFFFQTAGYWKAVKDGSSGSAQGGFNASKLGALTMPVPPLPEQQRIVGILDKAVDGIAKARANAEQNLQNARALFESHLQSVFTQRDKGWVEKTLGDVCEATQGVQIQKSEQSPTMLPGYRRYLYISDFESDKNLKYVPDVYPRKLVTTDDIIVANTGSAGKIFRGIDGILSNNLFKVSFDAGKVDRGFIFFFVTSGLFRDHQQKIMRGTANPHMGHVNFKSTPICVPSLETQKVMVAKIHEVSEETQRLATLYQRKLAAFDALKKSLLHQAFSGNL